MKYAEQRAAKFFLYAISGKKADHAGMSNAAHWDTKLLDDCKWNTLRC